MSVILLCLFACRRNQEDPPPVPRAFEPEAAKVLTIGDINPDQPVDTIRRLQPLADYLARRLQSSGISRVEVVMARSIEGMAGRMTEGDVDVFLDSVYPSLAVRQICDTEIILRSWARTSSQYSSVFIVRADGDLGSLDDLRGGTLAFEETYSTSGFLLPMMHLAQLGIAAVPSARRDPQIAPDAVRYVFSRDASNTVELVQRGLVDAGAISNEDLMELPQELRALFRVVAETANVPRRLVSIRPGLDDDLKDSLIQALLDLAAAGDPVSLENSPGAWAFKFDRLSDESLSQLTGLDEGIRQLVP